jgi:hypothetical protein
VSTFQIVSGWIIRLFGRPVKEAGERHAFLLTSAELIPGSWRLDRHNQVIPDNSVLVEYQERGWAEKVWEHTQRVWEKALATKSNI